MSLTREEEEERSAAASFSAHLLLEGVSLPLHLLQVGLQLPDLRDIAGGLERERQVEA